MKVLAVASEMFPLIKTGGLADVAGALPGALKRHGVETRTLLPGYRPVLAKLGHVDTVHSWADLFGGAARLLAAKTGEADILVLDAPHLFDRDGSPYGDLAGHDWHDNWRRFAAFGRAGADIAAGDVEAFGPNLVHAHDWQAGMTLAYMRYGRAASVPSIVTIHNLAFQGQFAASVFPWLGLPDHAFTMDGIEYYGGVGFLKAGLQSASAITTVSPTYAQEIRLPEFGMGLDGLLNVRAGDLHGIVNGIDTEAWDPGADPYIPRRYGVRNLGVRKENRKVVEERFQLDHDSGLLVSVISRLTWQKGMDVLGGVLDELVATGIRLAVLGTGDQMTESAFLSATARHRGRVGVMIGYDEPLAHLLQAGSDAIIVPSRFEPCGLTQLCALRYGTVPIVARTGGLADTVIDANDAALARGVATGLQFAPVDGPRLLAALSRAAQLFADGEAWRRMQLNGLKTDVTWDHSAAKYAALYRQLVSQGDGGSGHIAKAGVKASIES